MRLNRHERARLEQIRQWSRTELRKELDIQRTLGAQYEALKKILATAPHGMELDIFAGARHIAWLMRIIDREEGRDPVKNLKKALDRADAEKRTSGL